MGIFPYRVRFSKTGKLRFLSHHDLMRTVERVLRRTDLPLRMTEGFHPHPIIAFPIALGVGIESADEILEFELSSWAAPRQIEARLRDELPEGLEVRAVEAFLRQQRSYVDFVEYEAFCPGKTEGVRERIDRFLGEKEFWIERKSDKGVRRIDIRPYVMAIDQEEDRVFARIRVTDAGTAKPEEVLRALGVEIDSDIRIKKTYTELGTRK